jgi:hypothetical protein
MRRMTRSDMASNLRGGDIKRQREHEKKEEGAQKKEGEDDKEGHFALKALASGETHESLR